MRVSSLFIAGLLLSLFGVSALGQANDAPPAAQRAEVARRYGLDPTSSLDSRVRETSAAVLKMFEGLGGPAPTAHALTQEERRQLAAAFAALPPLHRRILSERLRSVNFLDGMPNTALTSTVNPGEPFPLLDITIRAAILHQNVSEWLTEKERTCFDAVGSPLSVSIEAGKRDALVYVLLHEATHIVDASLKITPTPLFGEQPAGVTPPTAFTDGIWSERTIPAAPYRDPLRERVRFYIGGERLAIAQATLVYESLRRTPFASLYGSCNWHDDLAEYVAVYHWTHVLKQPYRIVIRKEGKEIFVYEPMKSALVRSRVDQMERFYEKGQGSNL
jgi:hypothetical protein